MTVRQVAAYGVVGITQLAVEWGLFVAITILGVPVAVANVLARIGGASLGYRLNARFTFGPAGATASRRSLFRFCVSWSALTMVGTALVMCLELSGGLRLARTGKPVMDVAMAGVGFLLSKYWIYAAGCPKGQS